MCFLLLSNIRVNYFATLYYSHAIYAQWKGVITKTTYTIYTVTKCILFNAYVVLLTNVEDKAGEYKKEVEKHFKNQHRDRHLQAVEIDQSFQLREQYVSENHPGRRNKQPDTKGDPKALVSIRKGELHQSTKETRER